MAYTLFDIGACNCVATPCNITICLLSPCNTGQVATGVTVQVKTGSTVLETQVTDGTGCAVFTTLTAGSYTVATNTTNPRYAAFSGTKTLTCGGTTTITLSPAAGYVCSSCWAEPVPSTLKATILGTLYNVHLSSGLSQNVTAAVTPVLTTTFANCATQVTNPCTVAAGNITVGFQILEISNPACEVIQTWCVSTDCTQTVSPYTPPYPAPAYYTVGGAAGCLQNPEKIWSSCNKGAIGGQDGVTVNIGTNNPVPVNITITFPSGTFLPAPVSSMTLTE